MLFSIKNSSFHALLAALSITLSSQAYIYQIDVWEKHDSKGKVTQELYCLSTLGSVGKQQQAALLNQCKNIPNNKTLFIVEDSTSATDITHPKIRSLMPLHPDVDFNRVNPSNWLHPLADMLRELGHKVINTEARQIRLGALSIYDKMLPYEQRKDICRESMQKIIDTCAPTVKEIAQEFNESVERARTYCTTDGPMLARYYTDTLTQLKIDINMADKLAKTNGYYHDFAEYCIGLPNSISARFLHSSFIRWGAEILDMNALHHIYQACDYRKVCVIMHGTHIYNISTMLPTLGYTKIKTIGDSPLTQKEWEDYITKSKHNKSINLSFITEQVDTSVKQEIRLCNIKEINTLDRKILIAKPISNTAFSVLTKKKRPKKTLFDCLRWNR